MLFISQGDVAEAFGLAGCEAVTTASIFSEVSNDCVAFFFRV